MIGRWESQLSNISERLVVRCPVREASYFLAAFVADHQLMNGAVQIALSSPVSRFVDRRPPSERAVVATFYPLEAIGDPHPTYSVT
jgi:hypothetical protein